MAKPQTRSGELAWSKMDKINSELFTLTYGAIVTQMVEDYEDMEEVNKQLDAMGFSMGQRMVDEFLAKSGVPFCHNFKETCEVLARVAFKMYLGVAADVGMWNGDNTSCSILLGDSPLTDFVELPPSASKLTYCAVLGGIIRGALELINLRVECSFVRDLLRGDEVTEIRVDLKEVLEDAAGEEYKEE
eukprot:PLAT7424.1.p2 GENE.PLAT7424.1~~PLAT7424.1.p2  ORF type:complete len:188 (+),score=71.82 PLAT7424.1:34-597(+)